VAELRTYAGVEGDRRRTDRRTQLLAAGLELLGAPGGELTVRGACRVAGVATRYFYESFADRDALAAAVFDQVVDEIARTTAAVVDSTARPGPDRVRAGVATIVGIVADDPRKGRVLFHPELAARRSGSAHLFVRLFTERQPGPDDVVGAFVVGGLSQVVGSWLAGEVRAPRADLVDRCTALLLAAGRV
jgi:AcrR family transcriptional regulator